MKVSNTTTIKLESTFDELNSLVMQVLCEKYKMSIDRVDINKSESRVTIFGTQQENGPGTVKCTTPNLLLPESRKVYKFVGVTKSIRAYLDIGDRAPIDKIHEYVAATVPGITVDKVRKTLKSLKGEIVEVGPDIFKRE